MFNTMDDLMEDISSSLVASALDPVQEAAGPSELNPAMRKYAINLVATEYIGKFPIEYFHKNTDKKHDRIVAQLNLGGEYKKKAADGYMYDLVKKLNAKQNKITFVYHKNYLIANPVVKKASTEAVTPDPKNMPVDESASKFFMENDTTGEFTLEELSHIPLVKQYQKNGLNLKQAVELMEARVILNPFMTMNMVDESCFKNEDEYVSFLAECFYNAYRDCNYNLDCASEALGQIVIDETRSDLKSIKVTTEAVDRHRGILHDKMHEAGRTADKAKASALPYINRIKDLYDKTMGEEAVKEEIVKGGLTGWLLKWRRLFLKLIITWKSAWLVSAIAGAAGAVVGFPWTLILPGIALLGRMHIYLTNVKASVGLTDADKEAGKKAILNELELELKITREKIEDARAAGDTKARYQLMRVEHSIEKEITRIRYERTPSEIRGEQSVMNKL